MYTSEYWQVSLPCAIEYSNICIEYAVEYMERYTEGNEKQN